ncbi:CbiQ family ECF transporter T component [Neomicrococcus lactis]
MRGNSMKIGLFVPGNSVVHRAPLWLKYVFVLGVGVLLLVWRNPWVSLALVVVSYVFFALAGSRIRRSWWVPMRALWWIFVLLGIYQWWLNGWQDVMMVLGTMIAAMQWARLLVLTTPLSELMEGLERVLSPLRYVGLRPAVFSLAIAIMIRSIPMIIGAAQDTVDAANARGLGKNPIALAAPTIITTIATARTTGDALAARGILESDY